MKILILTGKFGMGHTSAAKALQQEFMQDKYTETKVIDIVEHMLPNMHKGIYKSFNKIADKFPTIYNKAYQSSESNFDLSFSAFFLKKFDKLMDEERPDMIVCTLHLAARLVSKYKQRTSSNMPLITCITDISSSDEWLNDYTDLYLAATEDVKDGLIEKGIPAGRIIVTGIPVRSEFKTQRKNIKTDDRNHVLLMGGGLGLLPKSMEFYSRLNSMENTKTTIITGNNAEMYDLLYGKFNNIEVIGYSNEVHKYMRSADVIVSKAGGITLFETIHSELPIIVPCPFLAQEVNNARFIERNGMGKVVWDEDADLAEAIEDVFADKQSLNDMRNNIKRMKEDIMGSPLQAIYDCVIENEAAVQC